MPRPFDAHDEEERAAIRGIVELLPPDHPARAAHKAGADAIRLSYLVESEELIEKLAQAWFDGYHRLLRRQSRSLQH